MKRRKTVAIVLSILIFMINIPTSYAHEREEHDGDIEYVLFGDKYYKNSHPAVSNIIQALEDAVYLCVDQYNGNGEKELTNLKNEKVPGLPQSIKEFDFTANYAHRNYTHRGWNVEYSEEAHWTIRQSILINTVHKELFTPQSGIVSQLPWLSNLVYGNRKPSEQCKAFCVLLYYVHILGDHIEAGEEKDVGRGVSREKTLDEKTKGLFYIAPLSHRNDRDNPGIIPDLITCCKTLFQSQSSTRTYQNLIQDLEQLADTSERLYESTGGINTTEKFTEYNRCANDLLEALANYVPKLLEKESFFSEVFYR